jgi:hypothetical protein
LSGHAACEDVDKGTQTLEILAHPLDASLSLHKHVAAGVVEVHDQAKFALLVCTHCRLRHVVGDRPKVNDGVIVLDMGDDVDVTFTFFSVVVHPCIIIALGGEVGHVAVP